MNRWTMNMYAIAQWKMIEETSRVFYNQDARRGKGEKRSEGHNIIRFWNGILFLFYK